MLLSQDLGRHKQCCLKAVFDCDRSRLQSNDCLAAANISLQQPMHRDRSAEILDDILEHSLLRRGRMKRQNFLDSLANSWVCPELQTSYTPCFAPLQGHTHFQEEQLLENQTLQSGGSKMSQGLHRGSRRGGMGLSECHFAAQEGVTRNNLCRQDLNQFLQILQHCAHNTSQDPRTASLNGLVNRHDPTHLERVA
jgi:hypothetical protein